MSDAPQSHHCPHHVRYVKANLIPMKTICSNDGAKVSATQPDSTAKSVNVDIQAVQPWCGPTSLTCGAPQGMVLPLGPARNVQRPSPHVHYAGSSHANVRISIKKNKPD